MKRISGANGRNERHVKGVDECACLALVLGAHGSSDSSQVFSLIIIYEHNVRMAVSNVFMFYKEHTRLGCITPHNVSEHHIHFLQ